MSQKPSKHSATEYDRGGYNPRPGKSEQNEQVGPQPTCGDPDKVKGKEQDQPWIKTKKPEQNR